MEFAYRRLEIGGLQRATTETAYCLPYLKEDRGKSPVYGLNPHLS